ncbi:hypothetical protein RQP46_000370 [Phenoliferia psychrophenolica]
MEHPTSRQQAFLAKLEPSCLTHVDKSASPRPSTAEIVALAAEVFLKESRLQHTEMMRAIARLEAKVDALRADTPATTATPTSEPRAHTRVSSQEESQTAPVVPMASSAAHRQASSVAQYYKARNTAYWQAKHHANFGNQELLETVQQGQPEVHSTRLRTENLATLEPTLLSSEATFTASSLPFEQPNLQSDSEDFELVSLADAEDESTGSISTTMGDSAVANPTLAQVLSLLRFTTEFPAWSGDHRSLVDACDYSDMPPLELVPDGDDDAMPPLEAADDDDTMPPLEAADDEPCPPLIDIDGQEVSFVEKVACSLLVEAKDSDSEFDDLPALVDANDLSDAEDSDGPPPLVSGDDSDWESDTPPSLEGTSAAVGRRYRAFPPPLIRIDGGWTLQVVQCRSPEPGFSVDLGSLPVEGKDQISQEGIRVRLPREGTDQVVQEEGSLTTLARARQIVGDIF